MQTPSNRMVVAPKKSVKDRLGQRVVREELLEIDECSDPEEENLRMGAISTLDLRKRIGHKRKFSEDENEEFSRKFTKFNEISRKFSEDENEEEFYSEPETKKVMSVVKKVKKVMSVV